MNSKKAIYRLAFRQASELSLVVQKAFQPDLTEPLARPTAAHEHLVALERLAMLSAEPDGLDPQDLDRGHEVEAAVPRNEPFDLLRSHPKTYPQAALSVEGLFDPFLPKVRLLPWLYFRIFSFVCLGLFLGINILFCLYCIWIGKGYSLPSFYLDELSYIYQGFHCGFFDPQPDDWTKCY